MVAYSSYLNRKNHLPKEALRVATLDTAVGLLAGLITFPVVMSFGLKDVISESTVGTLFIALPTGFANLGLFGRLIAAGCNGWSCWANTYTGDVRWDE